MNNQALKFFLPSINFVLEILRASKFRIFLSDFLFSFLSCLFYLMIHHNTFNNLISLFHRNFYFPSSIWTGYSSYDMVGARSNRSWWRMWEELVKYFLSMEIWKTLWTLERLGGNAIWYVLQSFLRLQEGQ